MGKGSDDSVTRWLERWREGDPVAFERLLPLVYADLRRIAASLLLNTPGHATLQTTALVHEMLLRLLGREPASFESGAHLLNASARMMRQVLVDRARRMGTEKRGGAWWRADFEEALELRISDNVDLIELDRALEELEAMDPRMAKVVELRCSSGWKWPKWRQHWAWSNAPRSATGLPHMPGCAVGWAKMSERE